jgi:hypothetical protein
VDGDGTRGHPNLNDACWPSFLVTDASFEVQVFRGTIETTHCDNDWFGLVLGYQHPFAHPSDGDRAFDFVLLSWTEETHKGHPEGFRLSRVNGTIGGNDCFHDAACPENEVWAPHTGDSTGWERGTTYEFEVRPTPTTLTVTVAAGAFGDGVQVIDLERSLTAGHFGLYTLSLQDVTSRTGSTVTSRSRRGTSPPRPQTARGPSA